MATHLINHAALRDELIQAIHAKGNHTFEETVTLYYGLENDKEIQAVALTANGHKVNIDGQLYLVENLNTNNLLELYSAL